MEERLLIDKSNNTQEILGLAEQVIQQTHYENLEKWPLQKFEDTNLQIRPGDVACLFYVPELVYSQGEESTNQLITVLNALHKCGASCLMLLQCNEGRSSLYLGAVNKQRYENRFFLNTVRDVLKTAIEGNMPGTELKEIVSRKEMDRKISECLDNGFDSQCITAVSCVAGNKAGTENQIVHGLESLLGAVGKKNFSFMILADPISTEQLTEIRNGYENLGTQLSALENISISHQRGNSSTESRNYSETISETISENITLTQSHGTTNGWSKGKTSGSSEQQGNKGKAVMGLALALTPQGRAGGYLAMNVVNNLFQSYSSQSGENSTETGGRTETFSDARQQGRQKGMSSQTGTGFSEAQSEGVTVQYSVMNQHIQGLKERLDRYLEWMERSENYGMFHCCAYVISGNAGTNLLVGSQYQALMQGSQDISMPTAMNTWTKDNGIEEVRRYLMNLMHPVLIPERIEGKFSTAMLLSGRELARQMALPRKSVVGISVMEYASFGREVVRKTPLQTGEIAKIGQVVHMGKTDMNQPVFLDIQSLTSHTFIAGTNGSGKSNTIYQILQEIRRYHIPFMVIEPAKGEYKNVFGHDSSVKIYGTNRKKTELLRLNPFWFGEHVDIKEHIENIMGVFNASWSMYDAMSSVLRSSITNAYRECGWDIEESKCKKYRIFPNVQDVLEQFESKMSSTAFSQEVKGNYVGALSTRLESLCTGICQDVFSGANFSDEQLFLDNVIIDLSRTGTAETKSMIMGILIIRLQEYLMSNDEMNLPLRHITVLEEAHHLLRKISFSQSDEGANLAGKSVEMMSNAIAELRSKGEGFLIVDQSPGLMDMSVIRNTNTKIIMRLPECNDRETVGNTIGLNSNQIYEISRLKTGVCAIYQKDWLEPVLCQVDKAAVKEMPYIYVKGRDEERERRISAAEVLIRLKQTKKITDKEIEKSIEDVAACGIAGMLKRECISLMTSKKVCGQNISFIMARLFPYALQILPDIQDKEALESWKQAILFELTEKYELEEEMCSFLMEALLEESAKKEEGWNKVQEALFEIQKTSSEEIKKARGYAASVLFGSEADCRTEDRKKEEYLRCLESAGGLDRILAEKVFESIRQEHRDWNGKNEDRKKQQIKEMKMAWKILGGDKFWQRTFQYIEERKIEIWDRQARNWIQDIMICDDSVETQLLDLTLRFRGSQKSVRDFYYKWLSYSNKNRSSETKNGMTD